MLPCINTFELKIVLHCTETFLTELYADLGAKYTSCYGLVLILKCPIVVLNLMTVYIYDNHEMGALWAIKHPSGHYKWFYCPPDSHIWDQSWHSVVTWPWFLIFFARLWHFFNLLLLFKWMVHLMTAALTSTAKKLEKNTSSHMDTPTYNCNDLWLDLQSHL